MYPHVVHQGVHPRREIAVSHRAGDRHDEAGEGQLVVGLGQQVVERLGKRQVFMMAFVGEGGRRSESHERAQ